MFMKNWLNYICLILISINSFGCASLHPMKYYEGAPLNQDQISLVIFNCMNLKLLEIDGKIVPTIRSYKFELLPGEHTFKFKYSRSIFMSAHEIDIKFTAEAGQIYILRDKVLRPSNNLFTGHKIFLWVEKDQTHEVVAGYSPGKSDFWGTYKNVDMEKGYKR